MGKVNLRGSRIIGAPVVAAELVMLLGFESSEQVRDRDDFVKGFNELMVNFKPLINV